MTDIDENDKNENAKIIGRNITNLLIDSEKTQQELADAIGVSKSTVSTWTNGKRTPRMSAIDNMCKFFGVPRSVILGDVEMQDVGKLIRDASRAFAKVPLPNDADAEFRRKVLEIVDEHQQQQQQYPSTIAAHLEQDGFTQDEIDDIENYMEFVKARRKQ